MRKIINLLALFSISCFSLLSCTERHEKQTSKTATSQIEDAVKKQKKLLPKALNPFLEWNDVSLDGKTIQHTYVIKQEKLESSNEDLVSVIKRYSKLNLIREFISKDQAKKLFSSGYTHSYTYEDTEGNLVHEFTIDINDLNEEKLTSLILKSQDFDPYENVDPIEDTKNAKNPFPFDKVKFGSGSMSSCIMWNPYGNLTPSNTYSFGIPYTGGPEGEEESHISISMIAPMGNGSWDEQVGHRAWQLKDQCGDASVYIGGRHNLIQVLSLDLKRLEGTKFKLTLTAYVDFQFEGVEYDNSLLELETIVEFSQTTISIPNWSNPDEVVIPKEWNIPEVWNKDTGSKFASRFIDLSKYEEAEVDEDSISFAPKN